MKYIRTVPYLSSSIELKSESHAVDFALSPGDEAKPYEETKAFLEALTLLLISKGVINPVTDLPGLLKATDGAEYEVTE